ncbi:hypothetical protein J4Q44_G00263950 [Coregonus suidteri]|uniref:Uncharacterized protein n=1 Tax=Coregonus suidteri TaxID=861788 RepID=A0AAN8LHS8_9TELE
MCCDDLWMCCDDLWMCCSGVVEYGGEECKGRTAERLYTFCQRLHLSDMPLRQNLPGNSRTLPCSNHTARPPPHQPETSLQQPHCTATTPPPGDFPAAATLHGHHPTSRRLPCSNHTARPPPHQPETSLQQPHCTATTPPAGDFPAATTLHGHHPTSRRLPAAATLHGHHPTPPDHPHTGL